MKKYAVIDMLPGDWFETIFDTKKEALEYAESSWSGLTAYDQKRREEYYVCRCSLDEDGCVDFDTIDEIVKQHK